MSVAVSQQYDRYPYPARSADPQDEREVLRLSSPGNVLELNYLVWDGRRDFTRPLRILVAGGGSLLFFLSVDLRVIMHSDSASFEFVVLFTVDSISVFVYVPQAPGTARWGWHNTWMICIVLPT
jgi:hypothetical protein